MKKVSISLMVGMLLGCANNKVESYEKEKPVLILENYLNGRVDAYGMFQDRSGLVVKRFRVEMNASWKDGVGTLEEDFQYSDGTKSHRTWTIRKLGENKYSGTASDVIGEAHGASAGNAFFWKYTLRLPVGDTTYDIAFDDRMYLVDEKVLINRAKMSKFGFDVGEVTITFFKQ